VKRQRVGEPLDLRLVHAALDLPRWEDRREIEDRARDRGDRHSPNGRDLVGCEAPKVKLNGLGLTARTWNGDLVAAAARHPDAVELRSRAVAEDGMGSGVEDRCDPPSVRTQVAMADRVNAAVDAVQPPTRDAVGDHAIGHAHRVELKPGDDPVLPLGLIACHPPTYTVEKVKCFRHDRRLWRAAADLWVT
jgi:hypothetical protein